MSESATWVRQFILFLGAGVVATIAHYVCMVMLASGLGVPATAAASIGYSVGAIVNYIVNYQITFKSHQSHRRVLFKFLGVVVCGFIVNALAVSYGTKQLQLHYVLAQLIATVIVFIQNFVLSKLWAFKDAK